MSQKNWSYALFGLLFGYFLFILISETQRAENFWDFKVYYYAASGEVDNMYDAESLQEAHKDETKLLSYKYLPLSKYAFKVFSIVDYDAALYIYIGLQALALVLIIFLMNRQFSRGDPLIMLVFLLAFNTCFYLAFKSGNFIPVLSLMILWAIDALFRDKPGLFTALIVIASCFKLFPIALLGLLWFSRNKRANKLMAIGALSFVAFIGLNMLMWEDFVHFMDAVMATTSEGGIINPNSLSFSQELSRFIVEYKLGMGESEWLAVIAYVALAGIVIWKSYRYIKSRDMVKLNWHIVSIVLLSMALLLPRFKDYDYLIVIPAAYYVLKHLNLRQVLILVTVLVLSSGIIVKIPIIGYILELTGTYQAWITALVLWHMSLQITPKEQL